MSGLQGLQLWLFCSHGSTYSGATIGDLSIEYIAGLFDGEGSVAVHRTKHKKAKRGVLYYGMARVEMAEEELIRYFESRFGGSIWSPRPQANKAPLFRWSVLGKSLIAFLEEVTPHLLLKRTRAQLVLDFQREHTANHGRITRSDERFAQDECAYALCRQLNCRHAGTHTGVAKYDRATQVIRYVHACDKCDAELRVVHQEPYSPKFDPHGNDPYIEAL